jgi:hypothetical protein
MSKSRGWALLIALLLSLPASADQCFYTILNTLTIVYTDSDGNVIGEDTRYFFGWYCLASGGGSYEIPNPSGGYQPPEQDDPGPSGGCTVDMCQANCDAEYEQTIVGEVVRDGYGGPTWYKCGPICVDLATSDRNACYAFCVEDCSP